MKIKTIPEDFIVEEELGVPLAEGGRYAVYQAQKRGITTLQLQARLAAALNRPPSAVRFPALKDRRAVTIQFGTLRGPGPPAVEDENFTARRVGWLDRPLSPRDVTGNRFTVMLRDLARNEAARAVSRLAEMGRWGLPNYYDEQRFGSRLADGEYPGKLILQRDEEAALRAHLAGRLAGDPAGVRGFKAFADAHWGDWQAIFEASPRPSNYRSVLTYLRDHPTGWRKALNLVTPRVLSIYLSAYQSCLWNRLAGALLRDRLAGNGASLAEIEIAGERLPLYRQLPAAQFASLKEIRLPQFHHRVRWKDPAMAALANEILHAEGFQKRDLKARVLTRAYLGQGRPRKLLLLPQSLTWDEAEPDDRFAGRYKLALRFFLPRGSYATLLLRAMEV